MMGQNGGAKLRGGSRRVALLAALSLPLIFLALFYFYPLTAILGLSFARQDGAGLAAFRDLFSSSYYLKVIWFTLWQAAASTVLTVILALPGAYVFARYDFPGKPLIQALTTVPFVLPTMVVALAFTAVFGSRGWLNLGLMGLFGVDVSLDLQYTLAAIFIAHIFYNYTVVLRIVGNYWSNLDVRLDEAARMLGASRWRAFREVTLPLLLPAVWAAALLVFIFCFTSFGVILVLGGPRFATIEVEIYRQTVHFLNLPAAAALSVLQILFTFLLMAVYTRLQVRVSRPLELRSRQATQRRPRTWQEWLIVVTSVGLMLVLLVAPLLALAARSMAPDGSISLASYRQLFTNPRGSAFYVPPVAAVRNSITYALATVVLSVVLGLIAAIIFDVRDDKLQPVRRLLDPLFMLPMGTSAVTLGLGYIVALDEPPLDLRMSPLLVVLAHTLVALPFLVRSVLPAMRAISPRLREAAALLGASPWRVWREVDLPIIARAVLVGAVFAFTISMGEFGATSLIARPERPTMPVAIYRFLSRPGASNYGQALAMSTLLMIVCVLCFLIIERFRIGQAQEF